VLHIFYKLIHQHNASTLVVSIIVRSVVSLSDLHCQAYAACIVTRCQAPATDRQYWISRYWIGAESLVCLYCKVLNRGRSGFGWTVRSLIM